MTLIKKNNASNFVFLNTLLWGSSYVWIKILFTSVEKFSGLLLCNLIGGVIIFIFFRKKFSGLTFKKIKLYSGIVFLCTLSNIFNAFGLQHTTSSNVAFITQMSVIMVPIIMAFLLKRKPEGYIIMSAVIAIFGVMLLVVDFSNFTLSVGDLYSLGAALTFSLYLISLERNSKIIDSVQMTLVYFGVNILTYCILALAFGEKGFLQAPFMNITFIIIIILNVSVNIFTILIQNEAAKYLRPEKVAIIYCMEPVVTLVIAYFFMSEVPNIKSLIGSLGIIFSILYMNLRSRSLAA